MELKSKARKIFTGKRMSWSALPAMKERWMIAGKSLQEARMTKQEICKCGHEEINHRSIKIGRAWRDVCSKHDCPCKKFVAVQTPEMEVIRTPDGVLVGLKPLNKTAEKNNQSQENLVAMNGLTKPTKNPDAPVPQKAKNEVKSADGTDVTEEQLRGIFDTADLEILEETRRHVCITNNDDYKGDLWMDKVVLKAINLTSQRLKAEVEKAIDEFYSKYAGYQVIVDLRLIKELKKRLGISQKKQEKKK